MAMARSDAINAVLRSTVAIKNTFVYDGGFFCLAIASSVERSQQEKKNLCAQRLVVVVDVSALLCRWQNAEDKAREREKKRRERERQRARIRP